ncbi:helix-turn-helix transcriptional regulator [Gynuella sp.]|uniref:helix-turn-helix transcriptional regulator n=1 Tax=Gynuella sp. TaxID=2969146 RepID=UPI003D1244D2
MKKEMIRHSSLNRTALADFLKTRRLRLQPETETSRTHTRRRTPGLRREEVAELAGISVDWYVKLEQGKANSASPQTIEGLIRALRLTQEDARHLKTLMNDSARPTPTDSDHALCQLEDLVNGQTHPAYLQNALYDVLAWNDAAEQLFGFADTATNDRNVLTYLFVDPRSRRVFGKQWAPESARVLAQFRRTYDQSPKTSTISARLTTLLETSPEFAQAWNQHDIHFRSTGTKHIKHPERGCVEYRYYSLHPDGFEDLSLVVLMEIQ